MRPEEVWPIETFLGTGFRTGKRRRCGLGSLATKAPTPPPRNPIGTGATKGLKRAAGHQGGRLLDGMLVRVSSGGCGDPSGSPSCDGPRLARPRRHPIAPARRTLGVVHREYGAGSWRSADQAGWLPRSPWPTGTTCRGRARPTSLSVASSPPRSRTSWRSHSDIARPSRSASPPARKTPSGPASRILAFDGSSPATYLRPARWRLVGHTNQGNSAIIHVIHCQQAIYNHSEKLLSVDCAVT